MTKQSKQSKQSEAAKKAWITRRKNEIRSGLSKTTPKPAEKTAESKGSAAKRAWRTRRLNELKAEMKIQKETKTKIKPEQPSIKKKTFQTYRSSMAAKKAWITRRRNTKQK